MENGKEIIMDNNVVKMLAEFLGVSENSIKEMPDEIIGSMVSILDNLDIQNEDDSNAMYEELNKYWTKGTVLASLKEVSKNTGIAYKTLCSLDYNSQQTIVYEYMMDSTNTQRFYDVTNKALAVMELEKVSKLINTPVSKLLTLPVSLQEQLCGYYAMEYEEKADNSELIFKLKEMVNK